MLHRLNQKIEFREMRGLKRRLIQMMWKFLDDQFSEQNKCTWVLFCDCNMCRNNWTKFRELWGYHPISILLKIHNNNDNNKLTDVKVNFKDILTYRKAKIKFKNYYLLFKEDTSVATHGKVSWKSFKFI